MEIKDTVSAATEVAKTAKEVLPQTTEQTDGALATLVGWFNNVVLYPVKKANITYNRSKISRNYWLFEPKCRNNAEITYTQRLQIASYFP